MKKTTPVEQLKAKIADLEWRVTLKEGTINNLHIALEMADEIQQIQESEIAQLKTGRKNSPSLSAPIPPRLLN